METYFKNLSAEDGTTEKLIQDLNVLLSDAEELVKDTGGKLASKSKEELMAGLEKLKASCQRMEEKASAGAQRADRIIRDNPYQSVGLAFGVGMLLGVLIGRD
jgi:ElaB/YqjD/DUF883 family membrane-anchored ribosome-binding protein